MKQIVHVNQHKIRHNRKHGTTDPPIAVRTYKEVKYGNRIKLKDKNGNVIAEFIYSPDKPLSCGARVWFETYLDLEIS